MPVRLTKRRGRWRAACYNTQGIRVWKDLPLSDDQPEHRARKLALEWEAKVLLEVPEAEALTLAEALDDLQDAKVRRGVAEATLEILEQKGRRLVEHFGPGLEVHTLRLADAEEYIDIRESEGGVGRHTVQKELGVLREALRLARRHGRYRGDPVTIWPADALRGAYTPKERWLPYEEYLVLLQALGGEWRPHLTISCWTGVRAGELMALRPHHVDRADRMLTIPGTKTKGSARAVPLSDEALEAMDALPVRGSRNLWAVRLARACVRAELEHASPNDLRRTFASWCANAGVSELETARMMGHTNSAMVRKVYAQLAPKTLRTAIDRMAKSVRPKKRRRR